MTRFALEIVKACGDTIGYECVGIRLSPGGYLHEIIGDKRDSLVFKYLLEQLNQYGIAYVHTGNFNDTQTLEELNQMTMTAFIRSYYQGTLIDCGSYTIKSAEKAILNKEFDLVAMGRPFIANPDLIDIVHNDGSLRPYDASMLTTLY